MVTILGLPQLFAKLQALPVLAQRAAESGRERGAEAMARDAAERAPRLTGALGISIGTDGERVWAEEPYARFVELGTSRMSAQPFLGPAFESRAGEVVDEVAQAVRMMLARL